MPDLNGLEAAHRIHKAFPKIGILILTLHFSDQLLTNIVEAGARAYIMKSDADRDLVDAVSAVAAGKTYFTAQITTHGVAAATPPRATSIPSPSPTALTERERDAVRTIAQTMRKLL